MALVYDVFQPDNQRRGRAVHGERRLVLPWHRPAPSGRVPALLDACFTCRRLTAAHPLQGPDAVGDVRRAVRHVRAHAGRFGIDPDRLGVYGGSAGGHLSLMLGLASDPGDPAAEQPLLKHSNRVHAVVAYFPPVDLRGIAGPSERFPALDFDPELAADISPIQFVSDDDPPVLLIHGDADELVPLSNSERMNKALTEAGVENRMVVLEGAGHGFRGEDRDRAQAEMVAFFQTHLASD